MEKSRAEWRALRAEYIKKGLYKVPTRINDKGQRVEMPTRFKRWYTRKQQKRE